MTESRTVAALRAAGAAMLPAVAGAGEARDRLDAPAGMHSRCVHHTYLNALTTTGSPLPVTGSQLGATVPILRYSRSHDGAGVQRRSAT